jgi:type VI secretion system secreted protein Hcp
MALDSFLKIEGVPGESTDDKHKEWIEILSYNWGVSQRGSASQSTGGGRTSERADFQDLSVTKEMDKATPELFIKCAKGEHIPKVILELCRAGGDKEKYMEYTLNDVIISSVGVGGGGGGLPSETITFNYGKITQNYIQMDEKTGKKKGNIEKNWSLIENKGS